MRKMNKGLHEYLVRNNPEAAIDYAQVCSDENVEWFEDEDYEAPSFADAIDAFYWESTEQGQEYWEEMNIFFEEKGL